ncbi:purine nucleoside phosphorylase LACC1 isoform X1 [Thunnus maccoyii]|uniref:purine nucleoside phosphorylase LACC1 isoform X1 n=2 Tax=Thunnus maccoyii TaxID=8240 RepID=UPI001C4AE705|nr:purine nucleoside phosphorylase LACC1 isoform X1 [Thunnus maccoyii]
MSEAVLVDLIHGWCPTCSGASLLEEPAADLHVFLLCGNRHRHKNGFSDTFVRSSRKVQMLDFGSTAECLYRFKQTVDGLDLSSVTVLTSAQGREVLHLYQELLFTAMYTFDFKIRSVDSTCPSCRGPAHTESPGERVHEEVSTFLQQLPALAGDVTTLTSSLIPDCFGHGFSTRTGGVSYIPTLSSLNLFSSSRRRDPGAVVMENRRRLALHAGFHPQPLRLVKVKHASDVWVMGKAEPESYDAIVTNQSGVILGAPGADCIPVLFADRVSMVIGVAHAGWKGTLMGVAMATVEAMVRDFGCQVSNIVVAIGPSVGACCFTLVKEQALDFHCIHPDCVLDPQSARPHVNIRLANRILLQEGGILPEHIHDDTVTDRSCVTPCTSCHPEAFFSRVRDGLNFGTQVGFLWIKENQKTGPPSSRQDGVELTK